MKSKKGEDRDLEDNQNEAPLDIIKKKEDQKLRIEQNKYKCTRSLSSYNWRFNRGVGEMISAGLIWWKPKL